MKDISIGYLHDANQNDIVPSLERHDSYVQKGSEPPTAAVAGYLLNLEPGTINPVRPVLYGYIGISFDEHSRFLSEENKIDWPSYALNLEDMYESSQSRLELLDKVYGVGPIDSKKGRIILRKRNDT